MSVLRYHQEIPATVYATDGLMQSRPLASLVGVDLGDTRMYAVAGRGVLTYVKGEQYASPRPLRVSLVDTG